METKNRFTYRGTVHEIGKIQTFNSGFKKCDIICKTTNGDYTDYAVFTAKKDMADKAQLLSPGDHISIDFTTEGHEWDGPKGKRWFGGLVALKIEASAGVNTAHVELNVEPPKQEKQITIDEAIADDMPF